MASDQETAIPQKARALAETVRSLGIRCRDRCRARGCTCPKYTEYHFFHKDIPMRDHSTACIGTPACSNSAACSGLKEKGQQYASILESYAKSIEAFLRASSKSKALRQDALEARLRNFVWDNECMTGCFVELVERRSSAIENAISCQARRDEFELLLVDTGPSNNNKTRFLEKTTIQYATAVADVYTAIFW